MAGRIGNAFISLWNRKRIVFPVLIALCALAWFYGYHFGSSLITLSITLTLIAVTLEFAFIGLIGIEHIETSGDYTAIPRVTTVALVFVALVTAVLLYLGGMLSKIFPPPPLPILLAIMSAMQVIPYVILACLLPPLIGYLPKVRPKWVALRQRFPFWGIYLGLMSGILTLLPLVLLPAMMIIGGAGLRIGIIGGVLIVLSVLLGALPRSAPCKVIGIFLVLVGVLTWFGASGGFTLGSILAVLGGAYSYSWSPTQQEIEPISTMEKEVIKV